MGVSFFPNCKNSHGDPKKRGSGIKVQIFQSDTMPRTLRGIFIISKFKNWDLTGC